MKSKILIAIIIIVSLINAYLFLGRNTDEDMKDQLKKGFDEGYGVGYTDGYDEGWIDGMENEDVIVKIYYSGQYVSDSSDGYVDICVYPDDESDVIGYIPSGEEITITETHREWGYTTYHGKTGWIYLGACLMKESDEDFIITPETIVWKSSKGECYHRKDCNTIAGRDTESLTLDEAHYDLGLRACSKCIGEVDYEYIY